MQVLVLAIGNAVRGDDGVAHRVADLLETHTRIEVRRVAQLTPELAEDVAGVAAVVLVDADATASEAWLERLAGTSQFPPITHSMKPGELVMLAQQLYNFRGVAYLCHVPAQDFAPGEALTPVAEAAAREAAQTIESLLDRMITLNCAAAG